MQAVYTNYGAYKEINLYSQDATSIFKVLLQNRKPEVRYAALGEVKIGDEVLAEAKNLLKNEESAFVREYLESL